MTSVPTEQQEAQEVRALIRASNSKYLQHLEEQSIVQREEAAQMRALLDRSGAQWLKNAPAGSIVAFCRVAAAIHLNPMMGEMYLIHGAPYVGIAGRRVLARRTGKMRGESAPRLPSKAELEVNGVKPGDVARIVEVYRAGDIIPSVGCGIVRSGEIKAASKKVDGDTGLPYAPLGRDPAGMAAKRAAVAAYKKAFPEIDIPAAEDVTYDYDGGFVESGAALSGGEEAALRDEPTGEPATVEDGEFTDAGATGDDAPAPPREEPPGDPHGASPGHTAEAAEGPRSPQGSSNTADPPRALPVTDLRSLIGWARDTRGWDGNQVAHALGGEVAGDIARLVRERFGDSYPAAADALADVWSIEDAGSPANSQEPG